MKKDVVLVLLLSIQFACAVNWNEYKFDMQNTGYTPTVSPCSPVLLWSFETAGFVRTNPSVSSGIIYFGSWDGNMYALYAHNGTKIWNYTTVPNSNIESAPAVYGGMVYFGGSDGYVYALNKTNGALIWKTSANGSIPLSSPAVYNGIVYIGSSDDNLYAINATSGSVIWTFKTGGDVDASPAVDGGLVFFGSQDKKVYAVNATNGSLVWSYKTGGAVGNGCCMVKNRVVYAGSTDKRLYALNASTGALKWSYRTGGPIDSNPSAAFGMIYVGSHDSLIYAFNETTGLPVWVASGDQQILESNAAIAADGRLIIGSGANRIICLNATTGQLIWNYTTGKNAIGGAAISNGLSWFGSDDRKMYAIAGAASCPGGGGYLNNSLLNIFDETDTQNKVVGEQVYFYANYTLENGTTVQNATCWITFYVNGNWTAAVNMTYNTSTTPYYYNRTFDLPGTAQWNVSCSAPGVLPKDAVDNFTISPSAAASVSTGKANYSSTAIVYYRMRLYNASGGLTNDYFDIRITDPLSIERRYITGAYPNNGTGVYLGNYSVCANLPSGSWLITAIIQNVSKGAGAFQVRP